MTPPRATYRLQLNSQFGFAAAAALAPYLQRLGITHVYTSPILKARPGSMHGYDIVAHDLLNPELGDAAQLDAMVAAFKAAGLKILLDFVPNHMGVGGADNPLWLDVLEWGSDSAYAGWFDIDWEPYRGYLHEKLLVPVLGDQYGIELDAGKLVLKLDEATGELAVWAYDRHKLPICPLTYGEVLGHAHPTLERLGDEFGALREWRPQVVRRAANLKRQLAAAARDDAAVRGALAGAIERVNRPDDDGVRRSLDAVIAKQHWRAAHFRVAGDDINYRRFFNINDLAGIRVELPEVFEHAHKLVLELLGTGVIDGLRIDHIDGLLEPRAYLERLRAALARAGVPDCYLIVEKILARGEALPEAWPVDGTTGYEFAAAVLQALVDPASEAPLTRLYRELTDEREPFVDVVHAAKLKIMRNEMASEVNVLARDAARVARQNPRTADFTHGLLRTALRELIAGFAVYRTYVDAAGHCTETDLQHLGVALAAARRRAAELDASVFAFLARLLTGKLVEAPRSGFSRVAVLRCAMKVQQLSGPVMAKGLEDTAFYRYNRFIALNDVGGEPQRIGAGVDALHETNAGASAALAAWAVGDRDARHEARRGRSRAPRGADGAAGRVGGAGAGMAAPAARFDVVRRAARRERRVLLLSVAARRVAARALRCSIARRAGAPRIRRSVAWSHDESRTRGEAAFDLGCTRRALRELGAGARGRGVDAWERLSGAVHAVRESHRAARRAQQLAPGGAQANGARCAGPLSRNGAVGL